MGRGTETQMEDSKLLREVEGSCGLKQLTFAKKGSRKGKREKGDMYLECMPTFSEACL